ncbi:Dynein assembly factor 3, axonemal [Araneus ventricosus]|uniref:Dynein assembly factor 3, axonemal n=1 Tax=Araneus ventricosus TaxID=182803 RepID=A0A4Y2FEL7_ARAVE|nr:Dynein assembly factor 3, axonemal [Araneus ventricosus]
MAEGNYKGISSKKEEIEDGHKIIYDINFHHLDDIQRTYYPLHYQTQCRTIPTSWKIELMCKRVADENGPYAFSMTLKRLDPSDHRVYASFSVSIFDVSGMPIYPPLERDDRMVHDDELKATLDDFESSEIADIVSVTVTIIIKRCHERTNLQCASKVNTDKNSINLSKFLETERKIAVYVLRFFCMKMTYRHLLNFWPLVPGLDLQRVIAICNSTASEDNYIKYSDEPFEFYSLKSADSESKLSQNESTKKEINCLFAGNCNGCLFKTLARFDRCDSDKVNLYVAYTFPESLIRDWLLLSLFMDSTSKLSLLEKAEIFLEILGNTHVRASTASFIEETSAEILKSTVSSQSNVSLVPSVSLKHLKQSEVDELVNILTYLKNKEVSFDIGKAWDNALRSFFGQRYDSRKNLFDYHFNMKLEDYSIINLKKYLDWCETGIAFKFRSAKYNYPNKTMAVQRRDSRLRQTKGVLDCYVGDIATSPYLVYGVESENAELFKKANNEYLSTSEDISKYNIIDMLNEFTEFKKKQNSKMIEVHFMFFNTLCKSRKFGKYFDGIYVPCDMMHCSNTFLPKLLKNNGIVVFETIKNVVNSTKEHKEKHMDGIFHIANSGGLTEIECDGLKNSANFKIFKHLVK